MSLRDPAGGVPNLALSHDGKLVAAGGETGTVLVWSVATGDLTATMSAHTSRIKGMHFLGSTQRLATLGYDGALKLWNLANSTLLSSAEPGFGYLVRSSLSFDGERLATFADARADLVGEHIDPALKVWDLLSAVPLDTFGNGKAVTSGELVTSKNAVAFTGDAASSVWDVRSGQKLFESTARLSWPIAVSQDGKRVATDQGVIDLATGKELLAFKGHLQPPRAIWSHEANMIASVSDDLIQVWDLRRQALLTQVKPASLGNAVGLSTTGTRLAVVSAQGAKLYDTQTGDRVAELKEGLGDIVDVEASLDGTSFRIKTLSAIIEIDVNTAVVSRRHSKVSRFGAMSACQDRIRLDSRADNSMVVTTLNGRTPPVTLYGHNGLLNVIDCDAGMQHFLTGGTHGDVILWDVQTAQPILRFTGHQKNVGGVGFLPELGQFCHGGFGRNFSKMELR